MRVPVACLALVGDCGIPAPPLPEARGGPQDRQAESGSEANLGGADLAEKWAEGPSSGDEVGE